MNRTRRLILTAFAASVAAGLLVAGAVMPGCAAPTASEGAATQPVAVTPTKTAVYAYQAYTAVESGLIIEQTAGRLTAEQHAAIDPYRNAARAALDAASKASVTGDAPAIQASVAAAVAAVQAYINTASRTTGGRVAASIGG